MKKSKKVRVGICIMLALAILTSVAFATEGYWGSHDDWYYSVCNVRLIPLLNDTISSECGTHICDNHVDNYNYARSRIGSDSSNYNQKVSYRSDSETSRSADAGWTNSKWAQSYLKCICYLCDTSNTKTLTYRPRS